MSRIGNKTITVPSGVDVNINGTTVTVKGSKGTLTQTFRDVTLEQDDNILSVKRANEGRNASAFQGLARALLNNMVIGVSEGFERRLEIVGTGYRAATKGKSLSLKVGYSHNVDMPLPEGVSASVENNTTIILQCTDKQLVGEFAAQIRRVRPPEPYKGKGIRYEGETVKIKAGKTAG
jgi:large subunit ribosomal protein L6